MSIMLSQLIIPITRIPVILFHRTSSCSHFFLSLFNSCVMAVQYNLNYTHTHFIQIYILINKGIHFLSKSLLKILQLVKCIYEIIHTIKCLNHCKMYQEHRLTYQKKKKYIYIKIFDFFGSKFHIVLASKVVKKSIRKWLVVKWIKTNSPPQLPFELVDMRHQVEYILQKPTFAQIDCYNFFKQILYYAYIY